MTIERPPLFNGSTSGPAWWREFAIWLSGTGAVDSFARTKMAFSASMVGPAKEAYKKFKDEDLKDVETLQAAFEKAFPGDDTADTLFQSLFQDPTDAFRRFLKTGLDVQQLFNDVEVDGRGIRGEVVKHQMTYFHWWVQQAFSLGTQVPATDMSEAVKGRELFEALPPQLQMFVNIPKGTLLQVTQAVAAINPNALGIWREWENRWKVVEKRLPPRTQDARPTGGSTSPYVYAPVSNQGQPSNTSSGKVIRGAGHLCFPDDPHGHAAYGRAMAQFNKTYGPNSGVSAYKPMPLTPGTLAPGAGVCDQCGQRGHIRPNCSRDVLPEREVKYRSINSKLQRQEDQATGATQVRGVSEGFNAEDFYYKAPENSEGHA